MFLAVHFSLCVCSRRLGHTGGAGTPRGDRAHPPTASIAAFAASSFGADMPPSLQTRLLALTSNCKLVRLLLLCRCALSLCRSPYATSTAAVVRVCVPCAPASLQACTVRAPPTRAAPTRYEDLPLLCRLAGVCPAPHCYAFLRGSMYIIRGYIGNGLIISGLHKIHKQMNNKEFRKTLDKPFYMWYYNIAGWVRPVEYKYT